MSRRIKAKYLLLFLPVFLLGTQTFSLAEDENPYLDITPAEASGVLNRLITTPSLIEKLPHERREQLAGMSVFQKTIFDQQKDLLIRRNLNQSAALKKLVANLYPPESELRSKFEAFSAFSERLEYLIATGSVSSLIEIRKKDSLLPEERQLLDSSLMGFIRTSIAEKLSIRKSSEALDYLILLPDELWVAEGKSLTTSVFAGMVKDEAGFSSDQVERFSSRLASLVEADPTSRSAVIGIFETSLFSASDRGDKIETSKLLSQCRKFQDDKLPAVFIEQLLSQHPAGVDSEVSAKMISELKERNELSLRFKLRLMWEGYFGPLVPILVGLSIFFPLFGVSIFLFVLIKRKLSNLQIENPFKSKKTIPGYLRPIEVSSRDNEDEYTRLLALFNLSDTATEAEIKKAYRNRMKDLHPDSGKADIALENSEEFRDLKHGYDRIIEIRSAWFQGRKSK